MNYLFALLLTCITSSDLLATNITKLLAEQAKNPDDALTNYNLGVAQYKASSYQSAAHNFQRAYKHGEDLKDLVSQARFNAGKSFEQYALHMLPASWENERTHIEKEKLDKAIESLELAIAEYKECEQNEKTEKNLQKAEETLEALKKKIKQSEKNNESDDKKDKGNQEKDPKQQQDSEQQNQQNSGQDQQQKNQNKQDGKKQKQESKKDDEVTQNNQQGDQDKKQDRGKNDPQETDKPAEQGNQGKSEDDGKKDAQEKQQENLNHNASPEKTGDIAQQHATDQGMQSCDKKQETMQDRRMQAILENLEADETKKQRLFLRQQIGNNQPQQEGQKPW
jgi:hypothetical protein